jgi:hypothetical protein
LWRVGDLWRVSCVRRMRDGGGVLKGEAIGLFWDVTGYV